MAYIKKDRGDRADHGFETISTNMTKRLSVAARGNEFTGKTYFSFTAPEPIAYFNFDMGHEGVIQKFASKDIKQKKYHNPAGYIQEDVERMILEANPIWEDFLGSYNWAVDSGKFRTIVIDKEQDVYELVRLAKLGTLSNDELFRFQYGKTNKLMRDLLRRPSFTDNVNLILLQGVKEKYSKKGKATGEMTGAGFKEVPSIVQVTLDFDRDGDSRWFTVDKCRTNDELHGEKFEGDFMTFPMLATMAVPGSEEGDWT